jgi:predicted nucleic acid-binding protein
MRSSRRLNVKPSDVPPGPIVVDTDVFSLVAWRRGRFADFASLLEGHNPLVLSFATVAELRAGALNAGALWGPDRRNKLEALIRRYVIATATDAATWRFAEIYAKLRGQLQQGGVNDMWTAAVALAQPTVPPIATANLGDFSTMAKAFPGLTLVHPDL